MGNKPSLSDVARGAGVTKTTVSIVLNGKGDKGRICRDTQNRIRAVARELGYQKQSTMPVPLQAPTTIVASKMAGLLLSASSPASSLALIQEGFVSFICCPSEPEPIIPVVVESEAEPLEKGELGAGNPSPQSSPARGEEAEIATMETPIPLTATESTTSDEPSL
jgi:hypothetical protein